MVAVTYYCPNCGAIAELERDASLADGSVTSYPLEGWEYATPEEEYENADGVRFICGADEILAGENGCGEPFYLSFIRFEGGEEVEPEPPSEYVEIGTGEWPSGPSGPDWPS